MNAGLWAKTTRHAHVINIYRNLIASLFIYLATSRDISHSKQKSVSMAPQRAHHFIISGLFIIRIWPLSSRSLHTPCLMLSLTLLKHLDVKYFLVISDLRVFKYATLFSFLKKRDSPLIKQHMSRCWKLKKFASSSSDKPKTPRTPVTENERNPSLMKTQWMRSRVSTWRNHASWAASHNEPLVHFRP